MPRKPSNLVYGVDDRPPLWVALVLAVQHLFFLGVGLIIPVMIMRGIGATPEQTGSVVSLSMVAAGVSTIIQSLNRGAGAGFVSARLLGVLTDSDLQQLAAAPLLAVPDLSIISWSFSPTLIVPLMVATLSSTLKSVATITMCQKINDADWKRPDMQTSAGGFWLTASLRLSGAPWAGWGSRSMPPRWDSPSPPGH